MITAQQWDQSLPRQPRVTDTFDGEIVDLIDTYSAAHPVAQAFLVMQKPEWVLPPHFHDEHQFQVIMSGSGTVGRHAIAPLHVHYAAPETGYGPITAGPDGLSYLTLRASGDTGAWYLHKPGSRERMRKGLKREQQYGAPSAVVNAATLAGLHEAVVEPLIPPRADGLAAHLMRLPPGQTMKVPAAHPHGGRFYVVTAGVLQHVNVSLRAPAVLFASADEVLAVTAGSDGLEVLVLQFPLGAETPQRSVS